MATSTQNFTKAQLINVLKNWGFSDTLPPKKGKQLVISWPKYNNPNVASITLAPYRSTYGKALYTVLFSKV